MAELTPEEVDALLAAPRRRYVVQLHEGRYRLTCRDCRSTETGRPHRVIATAVHAVIGLATWHVEGFIEDVLHHEEVTDHG